ncbi:helix-turn-helix domain-containing protein [Nitritalea halalkaliphila]|uniref:helix-turn-helix domain-containing protein n=1 Tax=Nitritalea halalkaliphila TaxID=590849 RepID=UPI0012EA43B9|nr:helix-turn-helix domain-containing protein [Nitritalea halalkaliphila]
MPVFWGVSVRFVPLWEIKFHLPYLFKKKGMANVLDPMDIKQIFSLHRDGLSNRKIASLLGISRNTINQYISWLHASDYDVEEILHLHVGKLKEIFPSRTTIDNDRFDA